MTTQDMPVKLRVINLGAGVQSSVVLLRALRGDFGVIPDCAIFADTQWEPPAVYVHLDWLEQEAERLRPGFKIYRVTAGSIRQDVLDAVAGKKKRVGTMPLYVINKNGDGTDRGGTIWRQCTKQYKIDPLLKKIRGLLGVTKGQRVPKNVFAESWIGISTDEIGRQKTRQDDKNKWQLRYYPLIEHTRMSRGACLAWFGEHYPGRRLEKSSCIGCPYHTNGAWAEMAQKKPLEFADAVAFDDALRVDGARLPGVTGEVYLHRKMIPLREVDIRTAESEGQQTMFTEFEDECDGMCGN